MNKPLSTDTAVFKLEKLQSLKAEKITAWKFIYEPLIFAVIMSVLYFVVPSNWQFVLTTGIIYTIFAASLGMLFGWTGIFTFGHMAFFGAGAYTVAVLKEFELSPLVFLLIAGAVAGIIAAIVSLFGLRLVKVEFAMMTLIIGVIAYQLTFRIDALEGDNGIYGIPRGDVFGLNINPGTNFWWYTLILVTIILIVMRRMSLSPFGESLNAVRDDAIKAAAVGIPVKSMRLVIFTIAGIIAGIAGGLFAQHQGIVTPNTLSFLLGGQVIIMALLGGMKRFWGPVIGALIFVALNFTVFSGASNGNFILGAILLVIVLVFPNGVLGVVAWVKDKIFKKKELS